jgi:hypothetical protein
LPPVPDRHAQTPISIRPPKDDRAWLEAHAEQTGRPVRAIIVDAIARERARQEAGTMDTATRTEFDLRAITQARALAGAWTTDSLRTVTGAGADDDERVRNDALGIARKLLGDLLAIIDRCDGPAAAQTTEENHG